MAHSVNLGDQLLFVLVTDRQQTKKAPPETWSSGARPSERAMPLMLQYESEKQAKEVLRVGLFGWSPADGVVGLMFRGKDTEEHRLDGYDGYPDDEPWRRRVTADVLTYLTEKPGRTLLQITANAARNGLILLEPDPAPDGQD